MKLAFDIEFARQGARQRAIKILWGGPPTTGWQACLPIGRL
jgi:hypothetical protein